MKYYLACSVPTFRRSVSWILNDYLISIIVIENSLCRRFCNGTGTSEYARGGQTVDRKRFQSRSPFVKIYNLHSVVCFFFMAPQRKNIFLVNQYQKKFGHSK